MITETPKPGSGLPTDPDIQAIRERWPDGKLAQGDEIPYRQMEQVLGVERGTYRWNTITRRWRKLVEEDSRIVIGTSAGTSFVVLRETGKLNLSRSKFKSAARAAKRSFVVADLVDANQLPEDGKKALLFIQHRTATMIATAQLRKPADLPKLTDETKK
jgi:hypothetical protein